MFKRIFFRQQTSILSAAFIIAVMVAVSRLLGLIRNRFLTDRFTEAQLDPYFAAFRIPNFIFELLVVGAISVAFIPVFSSYLAKNKEKEGFIVASTIINSALIVLGIFALVFFIFTPRIVDALVPGFSIENKELVVSFSRIMILFQVVPLVVGNFFTGMLQSSRQFLIPALAPVVYNVGIILGIVLLTPLVGLYAPVYGVIIGALLFALIHVPVIRTIGYRHAFTLDLSNSGVREIGRLMIPRTISVAASQIDATVDLILASLVGAGSVTIFTLAQQLSLVPLGLFGLPIAQAALPTFSEYASKDNMKLFKDSILTSLHQILFLILPSSAFLIVMKVPIVRLVYGADLFTWPATVMTARTLAAFSVALFAQAVVHLFSRAFFALHDSKTPVVIAVISILFNSVLSVLFIFIVHAPLWSLALSSTIAAVIHALLLIVLLDKKIGGFNKTHLVIPAVKIAVATVVMAIALYVPMKLLDQLVFDTTRTLNLLLLTWTASCIGLATYIFWAWFLNIDEVIVFIKFAQKLVKIKDIVFEPLQNSGADKA